ncbi:MAG: glycosyltransferase family 2 protein [Candidatus Omnitrophica bacterium]|nr:glycosyltransferase family 2 protein [Candidatus Omnitrophota bacterium]
MKLSIVVPCYNESENIPLILKKFSEAIKRKDIEVVLVNNGSTDETKQILENLLPGYPFAKNVEVKINQGYGFGILSGLNSATGDYLAWTHADMQTDPHDVIKGLELIEHSTLPQKTFVKGNRRGRPILDNFFTWGMGILETLYLGVPLIDINAQPNLFHRSFFAMWDNPPHDFSLDLYAFYLARKHNLKVVRFPVVIKERTYGCSKWNSGWKSKFKFIKRTLDYSYKLKRENLK